ncbi:Ig-like domain-containing protein [Catellatospora chokoriensis]|uniref:Ig-like domain-containing protein n=1 Tax=Catellatospora chokoriensis TaxID=310353 RepID=UPI0023B3101D|nr:Ig-like domain-containing protein [Catellatospora chokoriensis]
MASTVDLLVAYQATGAVSLISGAADRYTARAATVFEVAAPGVLANDVNYTGGPLQAVLVQPPAHGSLQLAADGSLRYTPDADFLGDDVFTYRATSGTLQSGPVAVIIAVTDQTPPDVTPQPDRTPNAHGWFNAPVTVSWVAHDPVPSSGVPTTPAPVTVAADGAEQVITSAPACDPAGNCATGRYVLSIDREVPSLVYSLTPPAGDAGWHNSATTVTFTCADELSGILTCPPPTVVSADTDGQTITATAEDKAGNTVTVNVVVQLDATAPTITATPYPAANENGWHNTDVAVFYGCSDALSGIVTCTNSFAVTGEGAGQSFSGQALDRAGNSSTATLTVNLDRTPPALGTPSWTANPKPVGTASSTMSVPASDALSGVVRGEYFVGADPGAGNATAMPLSGGSLVASLGAGLPVGVHDVGIRAVDAAGNWSPVATTMLVVFDPAAESFTGRNKKDLVPSLAAGDVLPGLVGPGQDDAADYGFTVEYRNGALDPRNDFHFSYRTGTHCNKPNAANCHDLSLDATGFAWMVVDQTNNSRGRFQGTATVTVDGVTTTNPFTVEGVDGDRLTPATDDRFVLRIYAPGASPTGATALYQASGSLAKGNSIRIR